MLFAFIIMAITVRSKHCASGVNPFISVELWPHTINAYIACKAVSFKHIHFLTVMVVSSHNNKNRKIEINEHIWCKFLLC